MKHFLKKNLPDSIALGLLAMALSFGITFVYAWSGPTATAPSGNVSAPINTSATSQTKSGGFWAGSLGSSGGIQAGGNLYTTYPGGYGQTYLQQWGLYGNGTIYIEPAAGATLYLTDQWSRTGTLQAEFGKYHFLYGNLGVGVSNPAYKLDVAGSANATSLCIAGDCRSNWSSVTGSYVPLGGGTMNTNASINFPNSSWGATLTVGGNGRTVSNASVVATNGNLHLDSANGGYGTYLNWYSGGPVLLGAGVRMPFNGSSVTSGHAYGVGTGAAYNNLGSIAVDTLETDGGTGGSGTLELNYYGGNEVHIGSGGSKPLRTSIIYDGNNGGYYLDPNSTSRLNYGIYDNLYSYGWLQSPIFYDANNNGYYLDPNGTSNLGNVYVNGELRACGSAGCSHFAYPNGGGSNYLRGTLYFNSVLYDENNTGYYLDPNSTSRLNYGVYDNLYSYGWLQSPIFYDANNNGYYVDPNGTNRLNYVSADRVDAPIMYDSNNTGYYVDPNGTVRVNYVVADNTYTYGNENVNDIYVRASGSWTSAPRVSMDCYDAVAQYCDYGTIKYAKYCRTCVNNSCSAYTFVGNHGNCVLEGAPI